VGTTVTNRQNYEVKLKGASERIGKMRGCNINANIEVSPKKHSSGKMNRKKKGGPRHHRPAHP
jgi:hypothetical protein